MRSLDPGGANQLALAGRVVKVVGVPMKLG